MNQIYVNWNVQGSKLIEYNVSYQPNLFDLENESILPLSGGMKRSLVIIDSKVFELYGEKIVKYFESRGGNSKILKIDCDETLKNLESTLAVIEEMEKFGLLRRSEPVIAIGGGSLLDIVGFACSIYRRGVPYIRIPTTLLSIVDVSVAVKTGINHFGRRNRLGTYFPPQAVYLDKSFIASQSLRDISNGMGEIFKLAVISDLELFEILESNAEMLLTEKFQFGAMPSRTINRAISIMEKNLSSNLWEENLMRIVDFGHTFSPYIELAALPELKHGEAVALDCLFSSCISMLRGWITDIDLKRIFGVATKCGLPSAHALFHNKEILQNALDDTVKHRNGSQNLPVPITIGGHTFVNDLDANEIEEATILMCKFGSL
jgi:3-dehydroquinate synthetase